jgi:hypothetical protein
MLSEEGLTTAPAIGIASNSAIRQTEAIAKVTDLSILLTNH